nr:immunoglobulin heavy chain junction region [Mus musculus]MBK4189100.1 immunoglobulin heavy chain junction region [Mus musculus]
CARSPASYDYDGGYYAMDYW